MTRTLLHGSTAITWVMAIALAASVAGDVGPCWAGGVFGALAGLLSNYHACMAGRGLVHMRHAEGSR